jgi:hypothetical protein
MQMTTGNLIRSRALAGAKIGLLAACVTLAVGATPASDKTTIRPFIALMHPGQVAGPQSNPGNSLTAFFQLDEKARTVTFTLSDGEPQLVWSLRGPAAPGQQGQEIAYGAWTLGPVTVGPLTKQQVKDLRKGRLYLYVLEPSAIPEPQRAVRGQVLPIPGVSYKTTGG